MKQRDVPVHRRILLLLTMLLPLLLTATGCADTSVPVLAPASAQTPQIPTGTVEPGTPGTVTPEAPTGSIATAESSATPSVTPTPSKTPGSTATIAPEDPGNTGSRRLYIEVSLAAQIVYIYEQNNDGSKGALVKTMLCSTGRKGHETPIRKWVILDNSIDQQVVRNTRGFVSHYDFEWVNGPSAVQYISRIWKVETDSNGQEYFDVSSYLFHSVPYATKDKNTLKTEEWNKLGTPTSDGCIRLTVADAKWIYDHAAAYSYVYTVQGTPDPDLWVSLKLPDLPAAVTRDPTDIA